MQQLKAAGRFSLFLLTCITLVPLHYLTLLIGGDKAKHVMPLLWFRTICRIFAIRTEIAGRPPELSEPTLLISNHISYLDVPLLGSLLPRVRFVAKDDVANWPLFGYLAKLNDTAFISRNPRHAHKVTDQLRPYLERRRSLVLFGEGTSTDGSRVEPIKSSLLSLTAANDGNGYRTVQPLTINVISADNLPPTSFENRIIYGWPVEITTPLAAHLWRFAKGDGAQIRVTFHAPIQVSANDDRKELAKRLHQQIASAI